MWSMCSTYFFLVFQFPQAAEEACRLGDEMW